MKKEEGRGVEKRNNTRSTMKKKEATRTTKKRNDVEINNEEEKGNSVEKQRCKT